MCETKALEKCKATKWITAAKNAVNSSAPVSIVVYSHLIWQELDLKTAALCQQTATHFRFPPRSHKTLLKQISPKWLPPTNSKRKKKYYKKKQEKKKILAVFWNSKVQTFQLFRFLSSLDFGQWAVAEIHYSNLTYTLRAQPPDFWTARLDARVLTHFSLHAGPFGGASIKETSFFVCFMCIYNNISVRYIHMPHLSFWPIMTLISVFLAVPHIIYRSWLSWLCEMHNGLFDGTHLQSV